MLYVVFVLRLASFAMPLSHISDGSVVSFQKTAVAVRASVVVFLKTSVTVGASVVVFLKTAVAVIMRLC